mgnify:CR=1 FL=1
MALSALAPRRQRPLDGGLLTLQRSPRSERGVRRRHAHRRDAGAVVPGAHPGLRPSGPVAARRHHAQPQGARDRARARRRAQGQGPALAAPRHPGRRSRTTTTRSDMPTTGGSVLLEGLDSARRCVRGEEAARGGRHHPGEGEHVGVRLGAARTARSADSRSTRTTCVADAVGIVGRNRRRDRRRVRAARHGHRHRRIDPRTVDVERHRRSEADARAAQPRRHHPAGAQLRHRRADGAQRLRRRGRARRHDRRRSGGRRDEAKSEGKVPRRTTRST